MHLGHDWGEGGGGGGWVGVRLRQRQRKGCIGCGALPLGQ